MHDPLAVLPTRWLRRRRQRREALAVTALAVLGLVAAAGPPLALARSRPPAQSVQPAPRGAGVETSSVRIDAAGHVVGPVPAPSR